MLRAQIWLLPAAFVVAATALAIGLTAVDKAINVSRTSVLFPGPPAGARSFLSAITQAMISFTGVVFSVTVVVLQLSSGQFSPRILRRFLQDRVIQSTLGVFVATFVYSMVVLREVKGGQTSGFVPRIAVTGSLVLVLASVAMFILYLSHVTNQIRVATVIGSIGDETRRLIEARQDPAAPRGTPPDPGGSPQILGSPTSGVVVSVNQVRLVGLAERIDRVLVVIPRVGDFLPAGAPLIAVHDPAGRAAQPIDDSCRGDVLRGISFDRERTMEQDVAFGLRQLVDIAERALSPSVNDPTTASQSIDQVHDILRRLSGRPDPDGVHLGGDGRPRLIVSQYSFADCVEFAVGELWRYGAEAAQIPGRLMAMLDDLGSTATEEHRPVVAEWRERVRDAGAPVRAY